MSDDNSEPTYTKGEVSQALDVVVNVTLDRVLKELLDVSYGTKLVTKNKNGDPKIKMIVDWDDVREIVERLRSATEEGDDE